MSTILLRLQLECDHAAREFLAIPAWGAQRSNVRAAVNKLTGSTPEYRTARVWLTEQARALPAQEEAFQKLDRLVHADATLRSYRCRPDAIRELIECSFPGRVRTESSAVAPRAVAA
jgi:hypothetical protein